MMKQFQSKKTANNNRCPDGRNVMTRWGIFNFVGLLGVGIQLIMLVLLKDGLQIHYLAATALAVEGAIVHNFIWHERWTWADRTAIDRAGMPGRLFRFNLATGLVSIGVNVSVMALLVGRLGMHYLPANLICIAAGSLLNFLASDRMVFKVDGLCSSSCDRGACRSSLRNEEQGSMP